LEFFREVGEVDILLSVVFTVGKAEFAFCFVWSFTFSSLHFVDWCM